MKSKYQAPVWNSELLQPPISLSSCSVFHRHAEIVLPLPCQAVGDVEARELWGAERVQGVGRGMGLCPSWMCALGGKTYGTKSSPDSRPEPLGCKGNARRPFSWPYSVRLRQYSHEAPHAGQLLVFHESLSLSARGFLNRSLDKRVAEPWLPPGQGLRSE